MMPYRTQNYKFPCFLRLSLGSRRTGLGKDRGIDIIAYTEPLGANNPWIKIQVKHRDQSTVVDGFRVFMSILGTDALGIFVASGGFTSDAKEEALTQELRRATLIDLENAFDLWVEHYLKLTQEARQRLPLKAMYFLAPVVSMEVFPRPFPWQGETYIVRALFITFVIRDFHKLFLIFPSKVEGLFLLPSALSSGLQSSSVCYRLARAKMEVHWAQAGSLKLASSRPTSLAISNLKFPQLSGKVDPDEQTRHDA